MHLMITEGRDMIVCPEDWAPVTGEDGNTYANECYARKAGNKTFRPVAPLAMPALSFESGTVKNLPPDWMSYNVDVVKSSGTDIAAIPPELAPGEKSSVNAPIGYYWQKPLANAPDQRAVLVVNDIGSDEGVGTGYRPGAPAGWGMIALVGAGLFFLLSE